MNGRVVSKKQVNTAIVLISGVKKDRLYKKTFKRTKKYAVLDELEVKLGDVVEIVKIKPVSKTKHWKITKVVGRDMEEVHNDELKEDVAEAISEVMSKEEKNGTA